MPIYAKNVLLIILITLTLASTSTWPKEQKSIQIYEFALANEQPTIPFVVDVTQGKSLFIYPMWGIHVVEFIADGLRILPTKANSAFDTLNFDTFTPASNSFIYKQYFYFLYFGSGYPDSIEIVKYALPRTFRTIEIKYKLNFADGSRSKRTFQVKGCSPFPLVGEHNLFPQ